MRASLSALKLASALAKVLPAKCVSRPRKVSLYTTLVPLLTGVRVKLCSPLMMPGRLEVHSDVGRMALPGDGY